MTSPAPDRNEQRLEAIHREVLARLRRVRAEQVGLGALLLQLRRSGSFFPFGVSTFPIYCEKVGLSAQEGRELSDMAAAAEVRPEVSTLVQETTLSVQKAATVAEVLLQPRLQQPGEDWLLRAQGASTRELRDLVKERREEARIQEPPVSLHLFVSRRCREGFARCRELASRAAGSLLTEGGTLEVVVEHYLERHDPGRGGPPVPRTPRPGGKGESAGADRTRAIRAADRHAVVASHGDRCWVEGCDRRIWLEFAHRTPFALGGSNDAGNLERLCRGHHMQRDAAFWRPVPRRDGRVVMIDRRGTVVGRYRARPEPSLAGAERPPP